MERLWRRGARELSDGELLTLVLGPGDASLIADLVIRLRRRWPQPADLAGRRPQELVGLQGMGPARVSRLLAALELGARCRRPRRGLGLRIRGPGDLRPLLVEEFRGADREHFLALYLDTRHRLTAVETVSIGSLNASLVHPREVFRPAVGMTAAAVIVAHNHPSGCPEPSRDDLDLTARLSGCGRLLGIELLDHLIVGGEQVYSIRQHGWPDRDADGGGSPRTEG